MKKLKLLLAFATVAVIGALLPGCSTTNKQQMTDSISGDGFYGTVSVPVTQSLKIGASMFVGKFNNTAVLQPTSTNQLYTPKLVVYTKGHGKQSVGGSASSYAPGSSGSSSGTGTNLVAAAASQVAGLNVASPSAAIADGSSDGSALVFGDAEVTDRTGTNRVMTINATNAPAQ